MDETIVTELFWLDMEPIRENRFLVLNESDLANYVQAHQLTKEQIDSYVKQGVRLYRARSSPYLPPRQHSAPMDAFMYLWSIVVRDLTQMEGRAIARFTSARLRLDMKFDAWIYEIERKKEDWHEL